MDENGAPSDLTETEHAAEDEASEPEPAPALYPDPPEEGEELAPVSQGTLDFDETQAYEAAPFPAPSLPNQESPITPLRQTAAVQAAEALERARDRAQIGGLLKPSFPAAVASSESTALGSDTPPYFDDSDSLESMEDSDAPEATLLADEADEAVDPPIPEMTEPSAEAPVIVADQEMPQQPSAPEVAETREDEAPLRASSSASSLRARLTAFVEDTISRTGTDRVALSDFQSYPLLPDGETVTPAHSALRLAHWYGLLADDLNASRDGLVQIALSDGRWLCVVTADSQAGGACASFFVGAPVPDELARQLGANLAAALGDAAP